MALSLDDKVSAIPYIGQAQEQKLNEIGVFTVKDLLDYFPHRYNDTSEIVEIDKLDQYDTATIKATLISVRSSYTRNGKTIITAKVADETGEINIAWFNQRYLLKSLKKDTQYLFQIQKAKNSTAKQYYCKQHEEYSPSSKFLGKIAPIYPQSQGVKSRWLTSRLHHLTQSLNQLITDPLPESIVAKYKLLNLDKAYTQIHFPTDLDQVKHARRRLGFDEMLQLAIKLKQNRKKRSLKKAYPIKKYKAAYEKILSTLPFELTSDQLQAVEEIISDISKPTPMNRLLNGDVGSGKTIVAIIASYLLYVGGISTVIMVPTTILASQHYKSFRAILNNLGVDVQIVTSKYKGQLSDKPQIIIGTHALLYKKDLPKKIGLLIIDEQHRFGVKQRESLQLLNTRAKFPHYLTMTATPIPRTLINIIYSEMDHSVITQLPKNRQPIKSYLIEEAKLRSCYKWMKEQINSESKAQAYIVYPLIEENEESVMKDITSQYQKLTKGIFKDLSVGLLHGKMADSEKNEILENFKNKKIDVLISTTVIEVGIDVPDANIMLIHNAERFGLAQLHQLRGRVGRGTKESYCYVAISSGLEDTARQKKRLNYFIKHSSGFDIAQFDLESRGAGEILGTRQAGIPDLKIADLSDLKTLKAAKDVAAKLMGE